MNEQNLKKMIRLTLAKGNADLAIRAEMILTINRNIESKLTTFIATTIMGPNGPLSYEVKEGFDYVLEQYQAALEGRKPELVPSGLVSN